MAQERLLDALIKTLAIEHLHLHFDAPQHLDRYGIHPPRSRTWASAYISRSVNPSRQLPLLFQNISQKDDQSIKLNRGATLRLLAASAAAAF